MTGFVSLVGAGPGDSELITMLGYRRLQEADVVVYDHLVNPSLFRDLDAEKIDVGKLPLHHKVTQDQINDMLVDLAHQGKRVVRLKSGDPYVFGRGGEECQYLRANQVECEVIPGITSAIAGPAAVGIPVTHRDYASQFHVITGHRKTDGQELDWDVIARLEGTTVFLMGMAQLPTIVERLLDGGRSPATPVAVIQWATRNNQRSVRSDLTHIVEMVAEEGLGSPALIVVGDVVSLMDALHPPYPLPLASSSSRE